MKGMSMTMGKGKSKSKYGGKSKYGSHKRTRARRGGDGAADWVGKNFGDTVAQQWANTFQGPGNSSNLIPTLPNAIAVVDGTKGQNQHGGRRRKRKSARGTRRKRGGTIWEQALVPFGIMGLQQQFGRSRKNRK